MDEGEGAGEEGAGGCAQVASVYTLFRIDYQER